MFSSHLPSTAAISLAVLSAIAAPASAGDPPLTADIAATAVDKERLQSASIIDRVRADYAHARGISGRGVTIALLDTGQVLPGFNALNGTSDVADRIGHGTHIAGILGAVRDGRGMFGLAYQARLLPVKIFSDQGNGSTQALDRGLRHAIGKAAIANMSVGAAHAFDSGAMREAVRAGMLIVASAGNERAANPGWPARFAREAWANNQIIAVGAVDDANRLAPFSNRAGDTAAWYLVAPGVGIVSTYPDDRYAAMSGTSMATPMVSGAAALVKQLWPALRADQVANILFVTATDLGAPGIDAVYGRGLLNVERALQPVGALTTTTLNGRTINVLAGSLQPSAATSAMWNLAASGQLRVAGVDDFERDFGFDLGATVVPPSALSLEQAMEGIDSDIDVAGRVLDDGLRAAFRLVPSTAGAAQYRLSNVSLLAHGAGGRELALGAGGIAARFFGAGAYQLGQGLSLASVEALANPYFSLVPGVSHAAVAQQLGGVKLRFGILASGSSRLLAWQDQFIPPSMLPQAKSGLVEVSKTFDGGALSISMSQTREWNAYLGSYSSGALSVGGRTMTSALQVAGAVMLAPKLALAGQASYGVTPGTHGSDSLVTEVSTARTNAFSLALVAADRLRHGDRVSLSLSQPLRAYAGRIVMDVLTGSGGGVRSRERLVFSMVPIGREMRAQLNYRAPAGYGAMFGLTLMVRRDPNNMAGTSMEKLIAMRYTKQF
jgi:subtilisin family serine protease